MQNQLLHSNTAVLLHQALNGDRISQTKLVNTTRKDLLRMAKRLPHNLSGDQIEDVIQQGWEDFQNKDCNSFRPELGHTVQQFFRGLLLNALKKVCSNYCPPGQPTRHRKKQISKSYAILDSEEAIVNESCIIDYKTTNSVAHKTIESLQIQLDVQYILDNAPELVRNALVLQYWYGYTQSEVALLLNINRSTLIRKIKTYLSLARYYFAA